LLEGDSLYGESDFESDFLGFVQDKKSRMTILDLSGILLLQPIIRENGLRDEEATLIAELIRVCYYLLCEKFLNDFFKFRLFI
jgi:hypothetical protein